MFKNEKKAFVNFLSFLKANQFNKIHEEAIEWLYEFSGCERTNTQGGFQFVKSMETHKLCKVFDSEVIGLVKDFMIQVHERFIKKPSYEALREKLKSRFRLYVS